MTPARAHQEIRQHPPRPPSAVSAASPALLAPSGPPATVVIADDAPHVRLTLHALLHESSHFRVIGEATDGAQAIEQCSLLRPDVLLLDLSMPHVDGFQALAVIRTTCPDTKVIVFSGQEPSKSRRRVMRLGATGYIDKSIGSPAVWNEILTILSPPAPVLA